MTPQERPVVVTGASSGIGRATAVVLAAEGHPVVLGARRLDRCERVVARIVAAGGVAHALPLDVTDDSSRRAFVDAAVATVGPVEVLVSNAGVNRPGAVLEVDEHELRAHLDVSVVGAQALLRAFGNDMVSRGRGDLVVVTSEVARHPRPLTAPYVAAKWALEGLVASLLMELEGTGVRVSCVRPGPTASEMGSDWPPAVLTRVLESWTTWGLARHPHTLPPEGVAAAVRAVVGAPPGVAFTYLDVQPVPPASGR